MYTSVTPISVVACVVTFFLAQTNGGGLFRLLPFDQDVCSGRSGHAEVVMVEYDPKVVTLDELLDVFWKSHDPTQVRSCTYL